MREQNRKVQTGLKMKYLAIALGVLLLAGLGLAAFKFFGPTAYVPPEYDAAAQSGVPSPADNMGYSEINAENGVRFSLASTMYQQSDSSMLIYLTNPESSQCVLMCEIKNENGDTLYKSGAIRHGEYIERLMPQMEIENVPTPINIAIYAFEPDNWYSVGEVHLSNVLQPN